MRLHPVPILFDRWLAGALPPGSETPAAAPRLDLVEHPDRFEIAVDLPGFRSEDVEVGYEAGRIWLRGSRRTEELAEGARVHLAERRPLRFRRDFQVGDSVDVAWIDATFKDGVLRVVLPKSERALPREIPVQVS